MIAFDLGSRQGQPRGEGTAHLPPTGRTPQRRGVRPRRALTDLPCGYGQIPPHSSGAGDVGRRRAGCGRGQRFGSAGSGDFDAALLTGADGRHWVVRVPRSERAEAEQSADLVALRALSAGVRARLKFAVSTFAGQTPIDGTRAVVYEFVYGTKVERSTIGPELAVSIGEAIAAIHALPTSFVVDAGLPTDAPVDALRASASLVDQAAATGLVPAALLQRWTSAIEDAATLAVHPGRREWRPRVGLVPQRGLGSHRCARLARTARRRPGARPAVAARARRRRDRRPRVRYLHPGTRLGRPPVAAARDAALASSRWRAGCCTARACARPRSSTTPSR